MQFAICNCLVLLFFLASTAAFAQQPLDEARVFPSKDRTFRIPFQPQVGEQRLREVHLLYSIDQGRTWRAYATSAPEQGFFQFTAPADGFYWFAVRTIDQQGRAFPFRDVDLRPGIKVIVDTQPPKVMLRALPSQGQSVGVEWDVRDENLDLNTLRLEYLPAGAAQYLAIRVDAVAAGQHYWTPMTGGPIEVRLRVSDAAGNTGEDKAIVTPGGAFPPAGGNQADTTPKPPIPPAGAPPGQPTVRMVNSKRISLNYRVDDQGPSGISIIELWYTQDGRNWQKYGEDATAKPPFVFDVAHEGLYGFSLVARSGVGLGERPPQPGDAPQIWVEVDETKPVVRLLATDVGRGSDAGNLTVTWTATDKNLHAEPITISYAEQAEGPWTTIGANLPNTGRYVWRMPATGVPFRFFMRVEAIDKAGNVGSDKTPAHVIVDLKLPKPRIVDVGAVGR
ncbi:hypothetical protein AYO44_17560 [Planctomycetaceae bacterium SCGC AG-212-F19]|nr:hypothetical protein AYO44_17560 [Planctomycetaceae bacterium SCGC AG-212-F19]